jgi:archaellum biogenesis protein FlaJ (TadC family)
MNLKHLLATLFAFILLSLLAMTLWASTQQPVWQWQGLTSGADRWWTRATLLDAYYGFVTFFVWVWFKERSAASKALWFIAIMALGNMAMAGYVLLQLQRLKPGESAGAILTSRRPG